MEIKKRISVVLKSEMEKRGLNFMEFSAELDIPRTTLQGYLKGTSSPRADSLEELADKLGISLAELVSGKEQPKNKGAACLEPVFAKFRRFTPAPSQLRGRRSLFCSSRFGSRTSFTSRRIFPMRRRFPA